MKKVSFLAGRWEGTEWVLMQDGRRQTCESSDLAEARLNGTVFLFQGTVKVKTSPETDPIVVYEGIGVLSYDVSTQHYRLLHFGTDGSYEDYECRLAGKTLHCERRDKENVLVRVTLGVDDAGRWIEGGEQSQDGKNWRETFGTQMSKVAAGPGGGQ